MDNSKFVLSFFSSLQAYFSILSEPLRLTTLFVQISQVLFSQFPVQPFSVFPDNNKIEIASSGNANYSMKGGCRTYIGMEI